MEKGVPIPADRAVFLADAHLKQDDHHTRSFLLLAEKAAAEGAALFLLGDIFDLWFGTPGLTFPFQMPVIDRLRAMRREGLRLYYVEGNRDFYLKRYHEGSTFDAVSEGDMTLAVGGRTVCVSHGDMVNRGDLPYRFWRALSKNRIAYGAISLLPSSVILPLADRMERKLRRSNLRHKTLFPEKECREFALRMFPAGVDFIVLGHFHQERLMRFVQGKPAKVLAALPSWREEWRYFYLTSGGDYGFRQFREEEPLL